MRFNRLVPCFLAVGMLVPLWCAAVAPYVPATADPVLEPWRWRELEELQELEVLCMDQAADGTYWFGCIDGIASYDGLEVRYMPFASELRSGIQSATSRVQVWALALLEKDELVAIGERSLLRRQEGGWEVVIQNIGNPGHEASIHQAVDGTVWVMCRTALWRLSADLAEAQLVTKASLSYPLTSFCLAEDGSAWLVRNMPMERADLIHIPVKDGAMESQVRWGSSRVPVRNPGSESAIAVGVDGRIWYVDNKPENGVSVFDAQSKGWETLDRPLSKLGYNSLTRTRNGTLWAGGHGLFYAIRPDGDGIYPQSALGLSSVPLSLYEARDDTWWVIGRGGRVLFLDFGTGQWKTYARLHFQCESDGGADWFLAHDRRIVSHDPATGRWLIFGPEDQVIDSPHALARSSHGLVWAAGSHEGRAAIGVFDGTAWTRFCHPGFALDCGWGPFCETADGTIWFGAAGQTVNTPADAGGALQYEVTGSGEVRLRKHHAPPAFPYHMNGAVQTPEGTIWLGSPTLSRYEPGADASVPLFDLPRTGTQDMALDGWRNLWVAKQGAGLYRKAGAEWKKFTMEDGLASGYVCRLLTLQDGTLLAATDRGISRFDGRNWARHLFSDDFSMSHNSGGMREGRDGSIWLNFSPPDPRSPRVLLNAKERFCTVRYVADGRAPETRIEPCLTRVSPPGNTHIRWAGRDPYLNTPDDMLQFSWRFNDAEWSPFSPERGRSFLNLARGRYRLEVRARDRDFNVDPTPARIEFVVVPPVWGQAWFLALATGVAILVARLVWIIIRTRERHLVERQVERERHLLEMDQMKSSFITNISHELNTPLSLISEPLKRVLASEADGKNRERIAMALRNAERVALLVSQLLDLRKLELGKMRFDAMEADLVEHVRESIELLEPLAQMHRVSCALAGVDACRGWFDPDKLRKIVQNLVGNAVKYTPAEGAVRILLELDERAGGRTLRLLVEDTGIGIEQKHLGHIFDRYYRIPEKSIVDGSGIGLDLTRELVELWGGTIRAESPIHDDPERPGSRFVVQLPIDRENIKALQGGRHAG